MNDLNISLELAPERSREASGRTLTNAAIIFPGVGAFFKLSKVHRYRVTAFPDMNPDPVKHTRLFGGAFIILGAFCLIGAGLQHWRALKRINRLDLRYILPWPLTEAVAVITLLIGLAAFTEFLLQ